MGLFDALKKKSEPKREKINMPTMHSVKIGNTGKSLEFYEFEMDIKVDYGQEMSNLVKARVQEVGAEECVMYDMGDYICFEIPENMTIETMIKAQLLEGMQQIGKFNNLQKDKYNHVGRIKQKEDATFTIQEPTQNVVQFVRNNLDVQILNENRDSQVRLQEERTRIEQGRDFKMEMESKANEYKEIKSKKQDERRKNPFLGRIQTYEGNDLFTGKVVAFSDYQGVDIQTGEVLRLNHVNKIAKDAPENGTYVYSAYIDRVENEDEEFFYEPVGMPVIFETAIRVDDILASGNKQLINSLLTLFSNVTQQYGEQMKYIGGLSREGEIYKGYSSDIFAKRIPQMIEQFNEKINLIDRGNEGSR